MKILLTVVDPSYVHHREFIITVEDGIAWIRKSEDSSIHASSEASVYVTVEDEEIRLRVEALSE